MNKRFFLPFSAFVVLGLLLAGGCSDVETVLTTPKYKTGLAAKEISISAIGKVFPQQ